MNRRTLILAAVALALAGAPAAAQRFEPTRFSVEVRGQGPDVILIPGLTAGREVWRATAAAVPGYRYHLIQVAGFAGEPLARQPLRAGRRAARRRARPLHRRPPPGRGRRSSAIRWAARSR